MILCCDIRTQEGQSEHKIRRLALKHRKNHSTKSRPITQWHHTLKKPVRGNCYNLVGALPCSNWRSIVSPDPGLASVLIDNKKRIPASQVSAQCIHTHYQGKRTTSTSGQDACKSATTEELWQVSKVVHLQSNTTSWVISQAASSRMPNSGSVSRWGAPGI